jgi:hypothetical protein
MDELMDEGAVPASLAKLPLSISKGSALAAAALPITSIDSTASPEELAEAKLAEAKLASDKGGKCEKDYLRHPTCCGNEQWMKNAGFFKSCAKIGMEVCPTCGLVKVRTPEFLVIEETVSNQKLLLLTEPLLLAGPLLC